MKHQLFLLLAFFGVSSGCIGQKNLNTGSAAIKQFLEHAERQLDFHGTVLVVRGNDTLIHKGYGYSDLINNVPTDKNIAYNTASIGKGFTAIAILKLAEKGKLSLQDPVTKYFRQVPAEKAAITIHHLLTHTSGIGQNYAAEGEHTPESAAIKIFSLPLKDSIGKKFLYSNDNYMLLGMVIERLTGGTWESFIRQTILSPLGMHQTFFQNEYAAVDNARVPKMDGSKPAAHPRDYGMIGSTGIFSTAVDLARFQKAISTDEILTAKSKELLFGRYTKIKALGPAGSSSYYAYAFFVTEAGDKSVEQLMLRGNEENWGTSQTTWLPKRKTSVIVLSNSETLSNGEKPHIYISKEIIEKYLE